MNDYEFAELVKHNKKCEHEQCPYFKKVTELKKENADLNLTIDECRKQFALRYELEDNLKKENKEAKGLLNEMRIALRQTKDGAKYNVSLLEDVDKFLQEQTK